jgi:branched-chain amino acid transport system substrate-binding protein
VPKETEVLYHVMVGPGVLTFVKEMGEHFGKNRPQIFGFVDSLEGVSLAAPGLDYLDGTYFWEAFPRYAEANTPAHVQAYRKAVGVNESGASVNDPKDVSTYSHMFGCWETLHVIKQAVEKSGYRDPSPKDYKALVEYMESVKEFPEGAAHPQGRKVFDGKLHQCYGHQYVSRVEGKKLKTVHRTRIEDSMYEPEADYTKQPL